MASVTAIALIVLVHAAGVVKPLFASSYAVPRATADLSGSFVEQVAAKVLPSVVTLQIIDGDQSVLGSGIILSPDGLIMTNNHVVASVGGGPHTSVRTMVTVSDGRTAEFDVIATDPQATSRLCGPTNCLDSPRSPSAPRQTYAPVSQ